MAGFVYIVQAEDTYRFKVGQTVNLPQRMRNLQLGSPVPLHLVGWFRVDNPQREEAEWHHRLGINRRHGEWFDLSLENLTKILGVCDYFGRTVPPEGPHIFDGDRPYYVSWGEGFIFPVTVDDRDGEDPALVYFTPRMNHNGLVEHAWPPGWVADPCTLPEAVYEWQISADPRGALLHHGIDSDNTEADHFHVLCYQAMRDARAVRGI